MITKRSRGKLPHWESAHATYFVTFRLADSLSAHALRAFQFRRNDIVATAKAMGRPLGENESSRLAHLFSERIETYLDAGTGACYLADAGIAALVEKALFHFEAIRYRIFAWCVMPNHVHIVFRPLEGYTLAGIIHSWKSYSAKEANKILGQTRSFWQREYYDHLIRETKTTSAESSSMCYKIL